MSIAGAWLHEARAILDRIEATQMDAIARAASLAARAIADGGLVHLFGTGHSRIPLEEMFPRYGSYPGFHPIAELSMTFHTQVAGANGQRQAMYIERMEGLAEVILANFQFAPADVMIVFSASGLTAVPIEMAMGARARGPPGRGGHARSRSRWRASPITRPGPACSITPTSSSTCARPPVTRSSGSRASTRRSGPGPPWRTRRSSTRSRSRRPRSCSTRGALPPVLTSAAIVGAERSAELFEAAYREHARRVARTLAGADTAGDD